jgi:hypothetical protein
MCEPDIVARMAANARLGRQAEDFVVEHLSCPSCASLLRPLPPGYPLYDVECVRCVFRAQVKRVRAQPRDRIRGGSWTILSHHLKTGHLLPPMFVCFGWPASEDRPSTVWFFPLVPAVNVRPRKLSENHKTAAGRLMTEYERMRELPHMVLL